MWALSDEERKTITCSVCRKKFSRASILIAHKKKHFDTKTYYCDHCSKMFSSESSYKHHIAYSGRKCNHFPCVTYALFNAFLLSSSGSV